jgi:hypothetical protein
LITSEQIRAASAILKMTVAELSVASKVGVATIKRIEAVNGIPPAHGKTIDQITQAMTLAGIEFIGTPHDRPGVRLNK